MSEVKRVSDRSVEFVQKRQKDSETFQEALERLLGAKNPEDPVTREDVEQIFDEKLNDLMKELNQK